MHVWVPRSCHSIIRTIGLTSVALPGGGQPWYGTGSARACAAGVPAVHRSPPGRPRDRLCRVARGRTAGRAAARHQGRPARLRAGPLASQPTAPPGTFPTPPQLPLSLLAPWLFPMSFAAGQCGYGLAHFKAGWLPSEEHFLPAWSGL